ncbi:multidrug effflux MFS transporter [Novacetimonas pomaceti]|uniref:Bcr/CflA family efflux transporter n=1 Tax=Novacetimonas pomaceti TaxID=2021998 RepID=A0A318QDM3_9PROT|nr:multidrug effflux MFS transporter [Novacetimonas pomaceti]PYD46717.1 multidrug ABC transporter [Novacetimonas pomaceti]PYD75382.1 multidrug ABC transporter [Novacetimonas pomaceti]
MSIATTTTRTASSTLPPLMPFWMIGLLGLLTAIGPLSTDMYLPAFPVLDQDLAHGRNGASQITLAAWFAGLAVGQFSMGPLSDRLGRRTPLIGGLAIFLVASIGCACATTLDLFCLCRFVAALGGSACSVVPRAIVRDVATGRQGAKIMSQLTLVFGLMPILAPSLGSLVLSVGHWRWIFWVAVIYAVVGLAWTASMLPDTMPRDRRIALSLSGIATRYIGLVREPVFMSSALITSFASFVMFAYLTASPILFEKLLHFTPAQFGVFFGLNAAFFITGAQINGWLVHRHPLTRLLNVGILVCLCISMLCLGLSLSGFAGPGHPAVICALIMGITGTLGFIGPNAMVLAFTHHGHQAGSASALMGTIQFSLAAFSGFVLGHVTFHSPTPLAVTIMVGVAAMTGCNVWRHICDKKVSAAALSGTSA